MVSGSLAGPRRFRHAAQCASHASCVPWPGSLTPLPPLPPHAPRYDSFALRLIRIVRILPYPPDSMRTRYSRRAALMPLPESCPCYNVRCPRQAAEHRAHRHSSGGASCGTQRLLASAICDGCVHAPCGRARDSLLFLWANVSGVGARLGDMLDFFSIPGGGRRRRRRRPAALAAAWASYSTAHTPVPTPALRASCRVAFRPS